MTDILIRGLSETAVARIDAEAAALGLSRNEFLRRRFEKDTSPAETATVSSEDWSRSASVFGDLADDAVMGDAWR